MEPLNVVEYISSRFVLSAVASVVNSLPFEHPEEPFSGSIIATVADCVFQTKVATDSTAKLPPRQVA